MLTVDITARSSVNSFPVVVCAGRTLVTLEAAETTLFPLPTRELGLEPSRSSRDPRLTCVPAQTCTPHSHLPASFGRPCRHGQELGLATSYRSRVCTAARMRVHAIKGWPAGATRTACEQDGGEKHDMYVPYVRRHM